MTMRNGREKDNIIRVTGLPLLSAYKKVHTTASCDPIINIVRVIAISSNPCVMFLTFGKTGS